MITLTPYAATITPNGSGDLDSANPVGSGLVITDIGSSQYKLEIPSGFGTKPNGQTSKVLWIADLVSGALDTVKGFHPTLSRDTEWQSSPLGEISTAQISAGATKSVRLDLGSTTGAMLAEHTLDTTPEKLITYRRRYEDFDVTIDYVRRTRIDDGAGSLPTAPYPDVGDTVTGGTSGATGIVISVEIEGGRIAVFYDKVGGTINLPDGGGRVIFIDGEAMSWDSGGSGFDEEGVGLLEGFNNKSYRVWNDRGGAAQHNTIVGAGAGAPTVANRGYASTNTEFVSDTTLISGVRTQQQDSDAWIGETFAIQNSDVDVDDGKVEWWKNEFKIFKGEPRTTQGVGAVGFVNEIVQHQVSNGCQPESFVYYSYLIFDDSHYFVTVWNAARDDHAMLPVVSWSDTEIIVEDMGAVTWTELDIHVDSLDATFSGAKP